MFDVHDWLHSLSRTCFQKLYFIETSLQFAFFLGTGKYTPNAAVQGDMDWRPILVEQ